MGSRKKNTSADRICDLTSIRKEPTEQQLKQLMHLVGEDGRKSMQAARNIVRQKRQQVIASGQERRKTMIQNLNLNKTHVG